MWNRIKEIWVYFAGAVGIIVTYLIYEACSDRKDSNELQEIKKKREAQLDKLREERVERAKLEVEKEFIDQQKVDNNEKLKTRLKKIQKKHRLRQDEINTMYDTLVEKVESEEIDGSVLSEAGYDLQ